VVAPETGLRHHREVPAAETFRLGGTRVDYLRGYEDYWVLPEENIRLVNGRESRFPGGRLAYIFTTEYQFPIVNPVHGLLFLDAGNSWNSPLDFNLNSLYKGVGAGIRFEIPMLGPVGFDYAYGIDRGKWQAHFIIGPAF
jgi:outer membrane protein insertion porin family